MGNKSQYAIITFLLSGFIIIELILRFLWIALQKFISLILGICKDDYTKRMNESCQDFSTMLHECLYSSIYNWIWSNTHVVLHGCV